MKIYQDISSCIKKIFKNIKRIKTTEQPIIIKAEFDKITKNKRKLKKT